MLKPILIPITTSLAPQIHEAVRDSHAELGPWMPWCTPDYDLESAKIFAQACESGRERGSSYEFAILDESGKFCGTCGLNSVSVINQNANLGYWVRTGCTGRGYATKAVVMLRDWAFKNTSLLRLEIVASVENMGSLRVAERAKAVREGCLRDRLLLHGRAHDAVVYSFLRRDYASDRD